MPGGQGTSSLASGEIEHLADERARERSSAPMWDVNVVVLAYAVLIAVVILGFQGVATEVVAPIATLGLLMVWFSARRRGKNSTRISTTRNYTSFKKFSSEVGLELLRYHLLAQERQKSSTT